MYTHIHKYIYTGILHGWHQCIRSKKLYCIRIQTYEYIYMYLFIYGHTYMYIYIGIPHGWYPCIRSRQWHPIQKVKLLKSHFATECSMWNDYTADFWEIPLAVMFNLHVESARVRALDDMLTYKVPTLTAVLQVCAYMYVYTYVCSRMPMCACVFRILCASRVCALDGMLTYKVPTSTAVKGCSPGM